MSKKSAQNIHISVAKQQLRLRDGRKTLRIFPVSTSKFGLGSKEGSMKTPVGRFRIAEKFGDGLPLDVAFKSRKRVLLSAKMLQEDDLIMSRILWLDGLQRTNANSHDRFIYIHGTNHEETIGTPASHGCIRMRNADVAELFDLVHVDTPVLISASPSSSKGGKKGEKSVAKRE